MLLPFVHIIINIMQCLLMHNNLILMHNIFNIFTLSNIKLTHLLVHRI